MYQSNPRHSVFIFMFISALVFFFYFRLPDLLLTVVPSLLLSAVLFSCDVCLFSYWWSITPSPCMFCYVWYFCVLPNKELGLMWILDTVYVEWYPNPNLCGHVTFHAAIWRAEAPKYEHQVARMAIFCTVSPNLCGSSVWNVPLDAVSSGSNLTTFRLTPLPPSSW